MAVPTEDFRQAMPQTAYQSGVLTVVVVLMAVVVTGRVKVVMLFGLVVSVSVFGAVIGAAHLLRVTSSA